MGNIPAIININKSNQIKSNQSKIMDISSYIALTMIVVIIVSAVVNYKSQRIERELDARLRREVREADNELATAAIKALGDKVIELKKQNGLLVDAIESGSMVHVSKRES